MTTTTTKLRLVLPWPPSINAIYRAIPRGGIATVILSKKGREYKQVVLAMLRGVDSMGSSRLRVTIYLHGPTRRAYDISNRVKALEDALEGAGIFDDDNQIDEEIVYRCDPVAGGKALVLLEAIT